MEKLPTNPKPTISSEMMKGTVKTKEQPRDKVILNTERAPQKSGLKLENSKYQQYLEQRIEEQERKIRLSYFNTITTLVYALEAKDKYTSGHSQRVANIATAIAQELGLAPQRVDKIGLACLIHDIGKIGVREEVLNKRGKLTDEEYQHVISHCEIGEHILRPIMEDEEILDMVRHHHEHYDGTGYPDGLSGKQIPLVAKVRAVADAYNYIATHLTEGKTLSQNASILAVADAYDAIMSDRSYRAALPIEEAAEELRRGAGTRFDPQVADALLRIKNSLISLFEETERSARKEARQLAKAKEKAKREAEAVVKEAAEAITEVPQVLPRENKGTKLEQSLVDQSSIEVQEPAVVDVPSLGISTVNLSTCQFQPEALQLIPESMARVYNVIPFAITNNTLKVAVADANNSMLETLATWTEMRIEPMIAVAEEIRKAIDRNYKAKGEIENQSSVALAPRPTTKATISAETLITAAKKATERSTKALQEAISRAEEARRAKEAEKQAKKEAKRLAKEKAKREAEEQAKKKAEEAQKAAQDIGSEIYEGNILLVVPSPVEFEQVKQFRERLEQVRNLKIVWAGGSVGVGAITTVSVQKPMPLIRILNEMPTVEKVNKKGEKIMVMLKPPSVS